MAITSFQSGILKLLARHRREAVSFVEAMVTRGAEGSSMQWARDSAYRFFPLVEDSLMGLTLHPFDLATNKVLAMCGRIEVRDWIDVLNCEERLQPFGYFFAMEGCPPCRSRGFSAESIVQGFPHSPHPSRIHPTRITFVALRALKYLTGTDGKRILVCVCGDQVSTLGVGRC